MSDAPVNETGEMHNALKTALAELLPDMLRDHANAPVAVVAAADEAAALAALHEQGTDAWAIGEIESGAGVRFTA